jgi:uncharacterized membrane protein YciS (DUF1049 family)
VQVIFFGFLLERVHFKLNNNPMAIFYGILIAVSFLLSGVVAFKVLAK